MSASNFVVLLASRFRWWKVWYLLPTYLPTYLPPRIGPAQPSLLLLHASITLANIKLSSSTWESSVSGNRGHGAQCQEAVPRYLGMIQYR